MKCRGIATFLGVLGALAFAPGCAKQKTDSFDGIACGDTTQYKSYMNPMDSTQIQVISIDSNFNSTQAAKIESAVATWNVYGRKVTGHDLFRTQQLQLSTDSVPVASADCGFPGAVNAFSVVKMTDASTWTGLGFTKDNPGVTLRCSGGKDFTSKQVVLLNTANMTDSLFESVILHELGHAIGLDHSCIAGSDGYGSYTGCNAIDSNHPYYEAVMFPYVNASNLKVDLRENDETRAQCALDYRP